MTGHVCNCGVTCTKIDEDGKIKYYCPRCNRVVKWKVDDTLREEVGINYAECSRATTASLTYPCDMCGGFMLDACRAHCPNCGWEKPCN